MKTHEKKLSNLRHNKVLPFLPDDVITNHSSYKTPHEEANILKYGLGNSIPPERLSWTDVFVDFDLIHCYLTEELKSRDYESSLRSNFSYTLSIHSIATTNRQEQFQKNKGSSKI